MPFVVTLRDSLLTYSGQAIPQITDEFNSLTDVGWYGSAYLLTCCSFQLLFGKLYTFFSVKLVLLMSVLLFEVGSVVCGAAPSSAAFIVGRAICGVSAAGIFAGTVRKSLFPPSLTLKANKWLQGCVYGLYHSSGKTSKISRPFRLHLWSCFDCRAINWWCLYLKYNVEMVLLYQSAIRWGGHGGHCLLSQSPRSGNK